MKEKKKHSDVYIYIYIRVCYRTAIEGQNESMIGKKKKNEKNDTKNFLTGGCRH